MQRLEDFGKLGNFKIDARMTSQNVKTVVEDEIRFLRSRPNQNNLRYNLDADDREIIELTCDIGRIKQVILSLLENASSEARTDSVIDIKLQTKPLEIKHDIQGDKLARNIDVLDFSLLLVCSVKFDHSENLHSTTNLDELNLEKVFKDEPEVS